MTVAELILLLKDHPLGAPVRIWGTCSMCGQAVLKDATPDCFEYTETDAFEITPPNCDDHR